LKDDQMDGKTNVTFPSRATDDLIGLRVAILQKGYAAENHSKT